MNQVIAQARLDFLAALKTGIFDGGSFRLYKNDYTPNVNTLVADLIVADFTGYANKTIAAWNAPYLDALKIGNLVAPLQTFSQTATTITNIVYGCFFLSVAVGNPLVYAERFATPVNFGAIGDTLNIVPKFQLGNL